MSNHFWIQIRRRAALVRVAVYLAVIVTYFGWLQSGIPQPAAAQDPPAAESLEEAPSATPPSTSEARAAATNEKVPRSLWDMYVASGLIGYIITILSMIGLGFIVEHFITIRRDNVMPEHVVQDLDNLLRQGQLDAAMSYCQEPQNASLFSQVVLAGIERYRSSEFGFAEYKAAVEEAGEEQTSRLYRKTEVLGVIGAIAPMLGLLGTVQGMILGFNMIATTGGAAKPEDLASSISLALVTTFEGLVVAIPAMVAFSFFRNRIDTLVAEAGKRVEQVLAPLGRRRA
jgi:biopolymer transport protein ExbB